MFLKPSAAFTFQGFTNDSTGTLATPGTPPTAVLTRNGTDDVAVTCTVTSISVGRYKVGGSIPSGYVAGDVCQVVFNATVGGISGSSVIGEFVIDTAFTSDLAATLVTVLANVAAVPTAVWDTLTSVARTASSYGAKLKAWLLGSDNKVLFSTDTGNTALLGTAEEGVLTKLATMINATPAFTAPSLALAPSGTGASAATIAAAVMSDVTDVIGVDILAIKAKTDALSVIPTAIQIRQEMDTNSTQLTKLGTPISASIAADIANQPGLLLGLAASSYNAAGTFGQKFNAAGSVSAATIATAVMSDVTDVIGVDILAIKVKTDALSVTPVVDILTALHADSQWQTILADVNGVFDYNESTHVLVLKDKTGTTTLATLTLTPGTAAITHRASA